jgi:segregation and condensation protein B
VFSAFLDAPAAEAEILALWAFDLVLALRLGWARPVPLIATKILDPGLRSNGGRHPKPDEPAWSKTAAAATALAATSALDLAAHLSRGSDTLLTVAPKLRAKPAAKIVDDRPGGAPPVRSTRRPWRCARAHGPACVPTLRPMTAAARRRQRGGDESLDVELADLPPAARWREWMLRIEAAIFASARPVSREALVRLVGENCRFDDLIADLVQELRGRPYDLALVAGGYALRTKTRFAPAIRAAHPKLGRDEVGELTRTETFALTAIAYLQPVTRGEISKLAGREISRDVIASLKRRGLIDGAIRAPQPGAPFAYVTTRKFLEAFGFGNLRDLPDLERLKAEGVLQGGQGEDELDGALGLTGAESEVHTFENAEE